MSRTYATLSPPMLEALDRVAATDGKSRTQVVNEAIQRWLEARGEWPPPGPTVVPSQPLNALRSKCRLHGPSALAGDDLIALNRSDMELCDALNRAVSALRKDSVVAVAPTECGEDPVVLIDGVPFGLPTIGSIETGTERVESAGYDGGLIRYEQRPPVVHWQSVLGSGNGFVALTNGWKVEP